MLYKVNVARITVMRRPNRRREYYRVLLPMLIGAWFGSSARAAAQAEDAGAAEIVAGAWQHRNVAFNYVAFTSLYTCDGLEDHVRQILRYLGARKDVRVSATGCPGSFQTPSSTSFVKTDFYSLVQGDPAGSERVQASWTALSLTPRRPDFVGEGDCELVLAMKDLISRNFSLRELQYRTACIPNEVSLDSFAVKGRVLKALPSNSKPVKG